MRRALLILIPLMLIVGAAFYFFVWSPVGLDIEDEEQQLATLVTEQRALDQRLQTLQRVNERLPEYDRANATMLLSLPETPQIDALTDELSLLATNSNVVWSQVSFSTPGDLAISGYRDVAISMSIEGQYFEVLGFLYGLSELDRLVRVDSINVSPSLDVDTGVNSLNVTINAVAFTTGEIVVPATPEVSEPDIPDDETEEDATDSTTTTTTSSTTTTTVGG